MRCRGANCPNVAALFGLSITGVMSNITAVADFVRESKTGSGIPGRIGIRSDLQPLYNLPLLDNEGGSQLISCLKKSFIACLTLRLITILVTTLRFALAVLNLAFPFLRSDMRLFVNVYRFCLLNGFDLIFSRWPLILLNLWRPSWK